MIPIGGENYYIDVEVLDELLNNDETLSAGFIEESKTTTTADAQGEIIATVIEINKINKPREVDGFKYDFYMFMIRTIMEVQLDREDDQLPFKLESAPINFTIAFNTLLYKKILKAI